MPRTFPVWMLLFALVLLLLLGLMPPARPALAHDDPAGEALALSPADAYGQVPTYFVANRGQQDAQVAYYAQGGGAGIFFTAEEVVLALDGATLRTRFPGAAATPPVGAEPLPTRVNYLIGSDPARWQLDLPTYAEVVYRGLYPGIDLHYVAQNGALKYTFVLEPGADVGRIRLSLEGAEGLRVDGEGDLLILLPGGELRDTRPIAYQEIAGRRIEVGVAFGLHDDHSYGFVLRGEMDPRYPLVIDPSLVYSSFLGGADAEQAPGLAVDGDGNVYVAGSTRSVGFPSTPGAYDTSHSDGTCGSPGYFFTCDDAFIAKMDLRQSGAASLVYATFVGGSSVDRISALAVDGAGQVYVKGSTWSTDWPTVNAYQPSCGGGCVDLMGDMFVAKLDATGSALLYSTYLGGSQSESVYDGLVADDAGHVYVVAFTVSTDFPTTPGAWQTSHAGGDFDTIVAWFDTTLSGAASLVYSSYLGASGSDRGFGLAVDASGNVYVGGRTDSVDFYISPGAFQSEIVASVDNFVTKFGPNGGVLYSTYVGGSSMYDHLQSMAVSDAGEACIVGDTKSSDWPTTPGAYQENTAGSFDAYLTCLNTSGTGLIYSTYLGGSGADYAYGIAVDAAGRAYVVGYTSSTDLPTRDPIQEQHAGGIDVFVSQFNMDGSDLLFSTYLGGSDDDWFGGDYWDFGQAIALDGEGYVYISGYSSSEDFPSTPNAYQPAYAGGDQDVFVAKLDLMPSDFALSGQVLDDEGAPMEGVRISAGEAYSATTSAGGYYSLTVPAGDYTLVPAKAGCVFTPGTRAVTVPPEAMGLDFVGQCSFNLLGQVLDGAGQPLEGILLAAGAYSATTDAGGCYTVSDVPSGTYTLVPGPAGYTWLPESRTVRVPPDLVEQDFVGWNVYKVGQPDTWQAVGYGDTITYTLQIVFPGSATMQLYDQLPSHTAYISGSLSGPAGLVYDGGANAVSGTMTLTAAVPTAISFAVRVEVSGTITTTHPIVNRACVHPPGTGLGDCVWSNEVVNYSRVWRIYLPLVTKAYLP